MRFAVDKNNIRVCIDDVDKGEIFFCQECGEKLVQRRGEIKAHHFAHFPNTKCIDTWHYDESDWHYLMQNLFPNESQEIVMELEEKKHRADVFIKSRNVVVQFQGDRIRQTEFEARNTFFTKLGHKVIWVFDESRPFENESIDRIDINKSFMRGWSRASKTFEGFHPEEHGDIEIWFAKRQECEKDEPNFFRVISDDKYKGFGIMECSHCYSQEELVDYILNGAKTLDRSVLYDVHYSVRRTDGNDYFYACPKSDDVFVSVDDCLGCKFCELLENMNRPYKVECSGRCRNTDLKNIDKIEVVNRNLDGFITQIRGSTEEGEIVDIDVKTPQTMLRTLPQLWDKYKPLKYMICHNVKTNHVFRVFNPAWQKKTSGIIKGRIVYRGSTRPEEMEIYGAEDPIWVVIYFARKTDE